PEREHRLAPAVRPEEIAVELHDAGPVAQAVATGGLRDEEGVDVVAARVLEPGDDLQTLGRRDLEVDHAARVCGPHSGHREPHGQKRRDGEASQARSGHSYSFKTRLLSAPNP